MRHKRHKKVIERASGYFSRKNNVFKDAHQQLLTSGRYAFRDRRARKRDFRRLWITRISAASRNCGVKYGDLIHAMSVKGIAV
ncbi:MAG: 50S ribosomal protein L20, partial [Armatimonadota bacterium]